MAKSFNALREALGRCGDVDFEALAGGPRLADVRFFLERLRQRAAWSMEEVLEGLASDLDVTGLSAWGRLYDQVSGTLEFDLRIEGRETRRLSVSMTRSLLEDPDPAVRRAALDGSNEAWQSRGEVFAACLNAMVGTRLTLDRRRGVAHFLDPALFDAAIGRPTLDALLEAVRARQDVPRRFLAWKARELGRPAVHWSDITAPMRGAGEESLDWAQATARVESAFAGFEPALGAFAREAVEGRWIDHSARTGKRPGGFCSTSPLLHQSRIFLTFQGALGDMATLAHELGHAWHGRVMSDMRPWARRYPMTLAETASTFAEQVVIDAALSHPETGRTERLAMLHGRLLDAVTFLMDIPTRFDFEFSLYEERADGELSVRRLCELMGEAQSRNFGDVLDPDGRNPWFWASKLHFYIIGLRFYNFPYTFGYLFALGLYAVARSEGHAFWDRYTRLLRRTGSAPAELVAREALGVDLGSPEFWNASIDGLAADLERFESEVGAPTA
jgi:oligoendopeptidase F